MIASLRNKFLIPTVILICIGLGIASILSYISSENAIRQMTETHVSQLSAAAANQLGLWIETTRLNVKNWSEEVIIMTAATDDFLGQSARETASERLKSIVDKYEFFEQVLLADSSGTVIAAGDSSLIGKLKIPDCLFFQEGMKGKAMISDVIQSKITGNHIFVIASPVRQAADDKIIGVLAAGIDLGRFYNRFVEPIRVGTSGYSYICNQQGDIIAHPDKEKILKQSIGNSDWGKEILKKQEGIISYISDHIEETAAVRKIGITGWFVILAVHRAELLEPVKKIGYQIVFISFIIIIIVSLTIFFISRSVTRSINDIGKIIGDIAEGNLSGEIVVQSQDEIGQMAGALNASVRNLRNMMKELSDTTQMLSSSSEELSSVSEDMASGAEEMNAQAMTVAGASEQIASGVRTVAAATEQSGVLLANIAAMTEEMSAAFANVAESGRKTSENVREMAKSGEDISSQLNAIASAAEEMTVSLHEVAKNTARANRISHNANQRTQDVNARMEVLSAASKKIGKIISLIKDIADQTNMLALNATIEAASAGAAGRGFAVVAGEIKELAKQSAEATDEIAGQIEEIQTATSDAVTATGDIGKVINEIAAINEMIASSSEEQNATSAEISKSVAVTAMAAKSVAKKSAESSALMNDIARAMEESSVTASEVAVRVEELLKNVKDVIRSADEAAKGVNDISKNIQGISTVSKNTAISASQTRESSKELAKMAASLTQLVNQFRV